MDASPPVGDATRAFGEVTTHHIPTATAIKPQPASQLAAQLASARAERPVRYRRDAASRLVQRHLLGQPLPTLFDGGKPLGGLGIERLNQITD